MLGSEGFGGHWRGDSSILFTNCQKMTSKWMIYVVSSLKCQKHEWQSLICLPALYTPNSYNLMKFIGRYFSISWDLWGDIKGQRHRYWVFFFQGLLEEKLSSSRSVEQISRQPSVPGKFQHPQSSSWATAASKDGFPSQLSFVHRARFRLWHVNDDPPISFTFQGCWASDWWGDKIYLLPLLPNLCFGNF